tara:strand:- start:2416 stop:2715 length:300 start_codon:yes stop_codon:yes gene_type:complete
MNNFNQISKTGGKSVQLNYNNDNFKESIKGIENIWETLRKDIEKKNSDLEEVTRMQTLYTQEDLTGLIESINNDIFQTKSKMDSLLKMLWEIRSRFQFN